MTISSKNLWEDFAAFPTGMETFAVNVVTCKIIQFIAIDLVA